MIIYYLTKLVTFFVCFGDGEKMRDCILTKLTSKPLCVYSISAEHCVHNFVLSVVHSRFSKTDYLNWQSFFSFANATIKLHLEHCIPQVFSIPIVYIRCQIFTDKIYSSFHCNKLSFQEHVKKIIELQTFLKYVCGNFFLLFNNGI